MILQPGAGWIARKDPAKLIFPLGAGDDLH